MIYALSPASVNNEETLSTLQYGDRAKKIKNHAVVNETVQDKIIGELKAENNELKRAINEVGGMDKILELKEQIATLERLLKVREISFSIKLEIKVEQDKIVDVTGSHITNVSEDHQLSGRVVYNFLKTPVTIGRQNADPPCDIVLASSSVSVKHCIFYKNSEGQVTLEACDYKSSKFLVVNGEKVEQKVFLNHLDRILVETSTLFLFKFPGAESTLRESDLDFEFFFEEKSKIDKEEIQKFEEAILKIDDLAIRGMSCADPNIYPKGSAKNLRGNRVISLSEGHTLKEEFQTLQ